nr:MAG TPA: hypothetical protein [Bacteriophage sp.]
MRCRKRLKDKLGKPVLKNIFYNKFILIGNIDLLELFLRQNLLK